MAVNPPRSCENSNIRRMWLTGGPKEKKKEDGKGIKGEQNLLIEENNNSFLWIEGYRIITTRTNTNNQTHKK